MHNLTEDRSAFHNFHHSDTQSLKMSSDIPVAVFVGGTAGIGQGMAEVFHKHTNGNGHIVLVGRNRDAAEKIIMELESSRKDGSSVIPYFATLTVKKYTADITLHAALGHTDLCPATFH